MKYFIFLAIASSLICCCKVAEEFKLKKVNYLGSELRIDGYYYLKYESGYCSFFLYKNGMFLSNGCTNHIESVEELDLLLSDSALQERKNKHQYVWGLYKVIEDKVIIERWETWNGMPFKVKRSNGNLISNTKFSTSAMKNLEVFEIYEYREFSPKPDSTNRFIK